MSHVLAAAAVFATFSVFQLPASAEPFNTHPPAGYSVDQLAHALRFPPLGSEHETEKSDTVENRSISTSLGIVQLRYPRSLRSRLGFSPEKSIEDAWAKAAELMDATFLPEEDRRSIPWNVSFIEDTALIQRNSRTSSSFCHTAFVGPPANIVIDVSRLLKPCSPRPSKPDHRSALDHSLIHEIGHVLEYRLLGSAFSRRQRWHGEGFASWFELQQSSITIRNAPPEFRSDALAALRRSWKTYTFAGSPQDYAASYALVASLAEIYGHGALVAVYRRMHADGCLFEEAVRRELRLSMAEWTAAAIRLLS